MGKFSDTFAKLGQSLTQTGARLDGSPRPAQAASGTIEPSRIYPVMEQKLPLRAPTSTEGIDPRLICHKDPTGSVAECFKILRTKLMLATSANHRRVILVTGAGPQDGKSLVAANLAVSIAQSMNWGVLLVDCDLRAPSLHQTFGLQIQQGLSTYLEDPTLLPRSFLDTCFMKTSVEKLILLPAGKCPPNPVEMLSSERMLSVMEELKRGYPHYYIILDSPPAAFAAETKFLSTAVDGVLLVVRSRATKRDLLMESIENIGRERILGVVFNASDEKVASYGYYKSYYNKSHTKSKDRFWSRFLQRK